MEFEPPIPPPQVPSVSTPQVPPTLEEVQKKLLTIPITDENTALNVIVSFLNVAQRRGVFSIEESSKIFECIKKFQHPI